MMVNSFQLKLKFFDSFPFVHIQAVVRAFNSASTITHACMSACQVAQSCLTFCNPVNCRLLGSSVHGIIQARVLEWSASAFSETVMRTYKLKTSFTRLRENCVCLFSTSFSFIRIGVSSVQFSCSVLSDSSRPHESQHARPPCPPPTPRVHSDSHPSSQ